MTLFVDKACIKKHTVGYMQGFILMLKSNYKNYATLSISVMAQFCTV